MKKISLIYVIILVLSLTSCLKSGLDDLPELNLNDILSVQRIEYRFVSSDVSAASGQNIVKFVTLTQTNTIDKTAKTVSINVTVPAANSVFPATEKSKVTKSNLVVIVGISTAARISPLGNAPLLGEPGDWSIPNSYLVTAADGTTAQWTISINSFVNN